MCVRVSCVACCLWEVEREGVAFILWPSNELEYKLIESLPAPGIFCVCKRTQTFVESNGRRINNNNNNTRWADVVYAPGESLI